MKNIKIHDIFQPMPISTLKTSYLELDNYSFLDEETKKKILLNLNEIKEEEGNSPAGLYEEYCIMIKNKLNTIQECINQMPNCTLDEFASRKAYSDLYMYIESSLNIAPLVDSSYLETEIPNCYDPEVIQEVVLTLKKNKTLVYISLILVFIATFFFFVIAGSNLSGLNISSKVIVIAIGALLIFSIFKLQGSLSKFMNSIIH